jgi:hypothetical protein
VGNHEFSVTQSGVEVVQDPELKDPSLGSMVDALHQLADPFDI